jgi:hypothetical protein
MLQIILSGDFPGYLIAGFEEDSPITVVCLILHRLMFD